MSHPGLNGTALPREAVEGLGGVVEKSSAGNDDFALGSADGGALPAGNAGAVSSAGVETGGYFNVPDNSGGRHVHRSAFKNGDPGDNSAAGNGHHAAVKDGD